MCQGNQQKQKILIVDDSEINRSILADILEEEYEIFEATDGVEAIDMIQEHNMDISAVLLDIVMPRMDGFEVLTVMNQRGWIEEIPVIVISAENDSKQVEQAYNLGVTDFITRPFDVLIVHRRVVNTILLYAKQKKLVNLVVNQIDEKERLCNILVDILSHIVEFRNGESGQHIVHIRTFTEVILRQLQRMTDRYALTKEDIARISLASVLHDIGKIAIDEKILNKPGKLTKEEFEVIKTHSLIGAQMLEQLPNYQEAELVETAWEICRWHHERYDGGGYPDGLKGDEIPISAQVIALADVYDALVSERCYKAAIPHETAIRMILDGECGVFNPILLECLQKTESLLNTEFIHTQIQERKITRSGLLKELLHGENTFASERSLNLIDQERVEYDFFSSMTEELQFKYIAEDNMLKVSPWSAKKFEVDNNIIDPLHNEKVIQIIGKDACEDIHQAILNRSPHQPEFDYECPFSIHGSAHWYRITIQTQWLDNQCIGAVGKVVDIHDVRMQIDALTKKASYDAKTKLLNHSSAKEQIYRLMELKPEGEFALAILDLDHFKSINDTYGHIFGDRILKDVAENMRKNVRGNDIVSRIGGDEFMIFMECKTSIQNVLKRIFNALIGTYENIEVSISMGVAETSVVGNDYNTLFHAADQALYSAKRAGRSQCLFYDDSMRETLSIVFSQ